MSPTLRDWYRSAFGQALIGGMLLWAALPPLNIWPLAWIAPVWWVLLIRREKLPLLPVVGRRAPGGAPNTLGPARRLWPWVLLAVAVLYFAADLVVTAWFHSMQYHLYWLAEAIFWPGLAAIFLAAARLWAAHPYRSLWLAGMFFWLAALYWVRLPYWAVGFGWLALGIYFGFYLPLFVGLSRVGVHRLRLPVILVAPVVYAGLELVQAYLLSGMTMGCLEHTQYRWTMLIQISDLTGCYGVTFLMIFVAACLARMLPCNGRRVGFSPPSRPGELKPTLQDFRAWSLWPLVPAAGLVAATLIYGYIRAAHVKTDPGLKMALIQGNIDIQLENPEGFCETVYQHYHALTDEPPVELSQAGLIVAVRVGSISVSTAARAELSQAELIVWPETVYGRDFKIWRGWVTDEDDVIVPPGFCLSPQEFREWRESWRKETAEVMTATAAEFGKPMIVGVDRQYFSARGRETFNTAVLITPDGKWCKPDRLEQFYYDKIHLVPFGEYMPFVKSVPWLQNVSAIGAGSCAGERPKCFRLQRPGKNDVFLAPNICYETVLPYVIRDQLVALRQDPQGHAPQILVNLTNDGWFWGSSELEQHLACGVFRTVECRRPMVIAANTGISASIDANGHILAEGPRRAAKVLLTDVRFDRRESWYLLHGDWFAGICLAITLLLACAGVVAVLASLSWNRARKSK